MRATDDGIFARSPQCPGLTFARGTSSEVKAETHAVLSFYFGEPGPFGVLEHEENASDFDGEEVVGRLRNSHSRGQTDSGLSLIHI